MKKLFHSRRIAKTLLCAITALTIGTKALAQVAIFYDSPIPKSTIKGYKPIMPEYETPIESYVLSFEDETSPIFFYSIEKIFFFEKISENDFITENGDTVFVAKDDKKTTHPIPNIGIYTLGAYLNEKTTENDQIVSEEYDGLAAFEFSISQDGTVSDVKNVGTSGHISKNFIDITISAIMNMPKWTPATKGGEPVESKMRIIINTNCRIPLSDNLAKNVQGTYKLTNIGREDGSVIDSPFDQYLLCMDNYSLFLFLNKPTYKQDIIDFTIERKYPAEVLDAEPVLESKKDEWFAIAPLPKVYGINKKGFTLKWFNNYRGYGGGPYGSWITETWKRNELSKAADIMMSTLKTKESKKNPFLGVWRHKWSNFYKIYGKDYSIILYGPAGGWTLKKFSGVMNGHVRKVEYIHKNLTMEAGSPCMIEWVDDNNFKLNYRSGTTNKISEEEWERVSADDNDDIYEIIQDIINCK